VASAAWEPRFGNSSYSRSTPEVKAGSPLYIAQCAPLFERRKAANRSCSRQSNPTPVSLLWPTTTFSWGAALQTRCDFKTGKTLGGASTRELWMLRSKVRFAGYAAQCAPFPKRRNPRIEGCNHRPKSDPRVFSSRRLQSLASGAWPAADPDVRSASYVARCAP